MPWRDLTLHSTPKQHPPAPWVVGTQLPWSRVEVAAREPCSVEIVRKVLNPDTVPFRPTRLVIVIRGSSRRIFSQVSSVIRGSAAGLDFMSSFFFRSVTPPGPFRCHHWGPPSGPGCHRHPASGPPLLSLAVIDQPPRQVGRNGTVEPSGNFVVSV